MSEIQDDVSLAPREFAPGTVVLFDKELHGRLPHLQSTVKGKDRILLIPQPSLADPNDPLRWPPWKKHLALFNGLLYSFNGAMTGPIMAAGMVPLSKQFGTSLQRLSYANGVTLVMQGVATTVWMPFAVKYGRRPIYMASNILMGIACVWLALASTRTYALFIAGRIFLGIFEAPIEAITPSTITDIFFLHDRGLYVSAYGLSVLSGNAIGPVVSAFVIQWRGMQWAFLVVAMIIAFSVALMFFGMPETKYIGTRASTMASEQTSHAKGKTTEYRQEIDAESNATTNSVPCQSYASSLKLWGRSDPSVSLGRAFLRPFVLATYPTVLWSSVVYGLSLSWNVILGATVAQLFAPPPYHFDSSAQGLIFISPFIGSLIGTYLSGPCADAVANYFTRCNDGIREPEMRLPTCAVAAAITVIGVVIAAVTYNAKTHWAGPVVGFGILSAGAQMGATLAITYSLDCHRELSAELMVTISAIKSLVAWVWTWIINDWINKNGMLTVFLVVMAINVVVYASTVILFFQGKVLRSWIHRTYTTHS